jgi:hypothetical protein
MDDSFNKEIIYNMVIRIISLENLLIEKNIVTNAEIQEEIERVSSTVMKSISEKILEQAFQGKQVDQLISDLSVKKENKLN